MTKSVYENAAKQAEADIPAKEAEIAELQQRLQAAMQELNYLRNIAAFGKRAIPSFTSTPSSGDGVVSLQMPQPQATTPAPPKSAYIKMHDIFRKYDRKLTVKEIVEIFAKNYNEAIPNSTLYFALNKGKRKHTFTEEGGKWGLAKKSI